MREQMATGRAATLVTRAETRDENGLWSLDGRRIIFRSVRDGNFEVYQVDADGSNPVRLTHDPVWDGWASFVRPARRDPDPQ